MARDQRALVLVNPQARRLPSRARLAQAIDALRDRDWAVECRRTERPEELTAFAARAAALGYDCVVACGGDGTLHGVLNGLVGSPTALAHVAAGTVNVWAREAGLPSDPTAALQLVADGARVRLDTGAVGGRAFLLMASAGLDSLVVGLVDAQLKRHLGVAAYLAHAAAELRRYVGLRAEVTIGAQHLQTSLLGLVAGNTRSYGGMLTIAREARADDGLLDVCLFRGAGRLPFLRHLIAAASGRHTRQREVVYAKARRMELATERPWPVQADGELVATTPVTIECIPRSVTMVVPAAMRPPLWGERREA